MFLDAISKFGTATISIPIATLGDSAGGIISSIGIGIPAASAPHLAKIGLFDHKSAEVISKKLFESTGATLTGQWMDGATEFKHLFPQGVQGGWHRIHGHHFLTDAVTAYKDPKLSVIDFYKHLGTDVVTKNGIPILPEAAVRSLADILGVTANKLMPWVSFNILDFGATALAVTHAGSNVTSIFTGTAEWGVGYAIDTFGVGAIEIGSGIVSHNPFLIGSGAADIACGAYTAHEYYSQPFFAGVPVTDLLSSSAVGASVAAVFASIEIFLGEKDQSLAKHLMLMGERVSTGGMLSALSTISSPLGITTSFGMTGFKLAKNASKKSNDIVRALPMTGALSEQLDQFIVQKYVGQKTMDNMLKYLE
jgi:hypothetical protein